MLSFLISLIPASLWHRSLMAGTLAVLLTAAHETSCLDQVRKLRSSSREGKSLYASAWLCNLFNNVVLGGFTYYSTVKWICDHGSTKSLHEQILAASGVVAIEAILYYAIHMAFHEVKILYWMHRYHHKFNTVVLPSSANAVSLAEYCFAYMVPLVVGVKLTAADEVAAFSGALVVAVTNLLIHTPWLEGVQYPSWIFVTASDHLSHHRKTRGNYGAPVFHLDRIMEHCSTSLGNVGMVDCRSEAMEHAS
jgi:sterol desaturase/sphingolipid hydroxylase (fatty acid hydroxylase superfamily)